jgi:hypothetical protein
VGSIGGLALSFRLGPKIYVEGPIRRTGLGDSLRVRLPAPTLSRRRFARTAGGCVG